MLNLDGTYATYDYSCSCELCLGSQSLGPLVVAGDVSNNLSAPLYCHDAQYAPYTPITPPPTPPPLNFLSAAPYHQSPDHNYIYPTYPQYPPSPLTHSPINVPVDVSYVGQFGWNS